MKKYNQRKQRPFTKRVFAFFMAFALCAAMVPMPARADAVSHAAAKTIYTEFRGGNLTHSGDGSKDHPFNLFEDALAAASDGDEISILENGAFLNATYTEPFVFDKSVTINGNGNVFSNRKGGWVLDADVTFKDVSLRFSNRLHDAIFANGHKLVFEDVSGDDGFRYVDIFGGSLYMDGQRVGSNPGTDAQILISGGGAKLGNIYAGSMNGAYSGSTEIVLDHVSGTQNGAIYASGAKEPHVNLDSLFDMEEPEPPAAGNEYTVSGNVEISLKETDTKNVYGMSGANGANTRLTVDTNGRYTNMQSVSQIGNVKVTGKGSFVPRALDACPVDLEEGSAIDLSEIKNPEVTSITSSGAENRLILEKTQTLQVEDTVTGELTFETLNGRNGKSGTAEYGHPYVKLGRSGNGKISFEPAEAQSGMTLESELSGNGQIWKTSELVGDEPVAIKNLTVRNPVLTTTVSQMGKSDSVPYFVDVMWQEDTSQRELIRVPIAYEVEFNGQTYHSQNLEYGSIPELHLTLESWTENDIHTITPNIYMDGGDDKPEPPEAGTYYITIRPFSAGEQIERKVTLIIKEDFDSAVTPIETQTTVSASKTPVSMQDTLSLEVQTSYTGSGMQSSSVPDADLSVYVNQTLYDGSDLKTKQGKATISIPVTAEHGFGLGENTIVVSYAGAVEGQNLACPSQANETITVEPLSVKLSYETINQTAVYNGQKQNCPVPTMNVVRADTNEVVEALVQPEVTYKQKDKEVIPVVPGSYEVWVRVDGTQYDAIEECAGTFTITAATPAIRLAAETQDDAVHLYAQVDGVRNGRLPVGTVSFLQDGKRIGSQESLSYGEAGVVVSNLQRGVTYQFQAVYEPEYPDGEAYYVSVTSDGVKVTVGEDASDDTDSGNTGDGGNTGATTGGGIGGDQSGEDSGNTGDSTGGDNNSGNTGDSTGGDNNSGNTGDSTGGDNSGDDGDHTGDNTTGSGDTNGSGSTGTTTGGGISGDGTTGGDSSGNTGDSTSGDNNSGNTGGSTGENTTDNSAGKTDASSNATAPTVMVSVSSKNNTAKVKVTADMIAQAIAQNAGRHTDVTIHVADKTGALLYTLTVNTADVKAGKKLYLCEIDKKTGAYVLVNDKSYKVTKAGNINVSAAANKDYALVNQSDMKQVTAAVLKTVVLKHKNVQLQAGKQTKVSLAKTLNMNNVKSISYQSSNKSVASVSKNGTVKTKKKGTATIRVTVTLNNGKVKVLKLKVKAK